MPTRLEVLEQVVARGVNDPFPHYGLAQEYRSQNRLEDAVKAFEAMRAKFPDYVPQYLMAGQLLQQLGRIDAAREWLTAGVAAARKARDSHAAGEIESALEALGS